MYRTSRVQGTVPTCFVRIYNNIKCYSYILILATLALEYSTLRDICAEQFIHRIPMRSKCMGDRKVHNMS